MRKIELLAPAGNKDAFYAAINNGADAVYMGGTNFSARAFADNFTRDDFAELITYAHLRDVKVYITLNTLLTDYEFTKACEEVKFYYENNADALLVQDLGLLYWIKMNYPDMEVHASTQMHIHNLNGVKNASKLGINRVVLARESTLDLIKEACKEDVEIEAFVHGAICVSYSGQCLFSSSVKSRSANKGMCAQCCRLKYQLLDEDMNKINCDTEYLLSPKDMFLLEDIPALIEAGVTSLKIEGRMKSSAYVGYITSIYRKAIDSYYNKSNFHLSNLEKNNIKVLFNRGFTNTYLHDTKEDIFVSQMPNHQGIKIGEVLSWHNSKVQIKLLENLKQFDGVRIYSKNFDDGFIVNKLYVKNKLVSHAFKNEIIELETSHQFKKGDLLLKTVDSDLENEINNRPNKYLPLDLKVIIKINEKIKIICDDFEYQSECIALEAVNAPLTFENIEKQFAKLKLTPYYLNNIDIDLDKVFVRVSDLNTVRNEFVNAYNNYRLSKFKHHGRSIQVKLNQLEKDNDNLEYIVNDNYLNSYKLLDVVNINSNYENKENVFVSELGGLLLNTKKNAFYTLNVANSYTYEFLKRLGFSDICLSTELNGEQILKLIDEYKNRCNTDTKPLIYCGKTRTLMYIRNNPFSKYKEATFIQDKDQTYTINYHEDYTEISEPYKAKAEHITCRKII